MADRSLRGMRLGAQSLQSEEGIVLMERTKHVYVCTRCQRETPVNFAADAEAPETWECRTCGEESVLQNEAGESVQSDDSDDKAVRTHWDMLLERRTKAELEEILEERLNYLKQRRGEITGAE